jgi:hypothetical protein
LFHKIEECIQQQKQLSSFVHTSLRHIRADIVTCVQVNIYGWSKRELILLLLGQYGVSVRHKEKLLRKQAQQETCPIIGSDIDIESKNNADDRRKIVSELATIEWDSKLRCMISLELWRWNKQRKQYLEQLQHPRENSVHPHDNDSMHLSDDDNISNSDSESESASDMDEE